VPPPDPETVVYCGGKVRHPSRKVAQENLSRVRRNLRMFKKDRGSLDVYYCPACMGFHLGNSRGQRKRPDRPRADRPRSRDWEVDEDDQDVA
jgi:hypothetical protein